MSSELKRGSKSEQLKADEESITSFYSVIMNDDSDLNDYERDALNAAFENIDSLVDKREVGLNTTIPHDCFVDALSNSIGYFREVQANQGNGGETIKSKWNDSKEVGLKMSTGDDHFGVQGSCCLDALSNHIGYFGEVQVNQENGGETLKSKKEDSKEIGRKMSMDGGCFVEWGGRFVDASSNPMGNFGEVQVNQENSGESFNYIRDDSKQVGMNKSTGDGHFREQGSRFANASSKSMGCVGEVCKNQKMVKIL